MDGASRPAACDAPRDDRAMTSASAPRWLWLLFAALLAYRLVYHVRYLLLDPFALATFSDGSMYEEAARDILAHPPMGSRPFYLQGAYAYVLAAGMSLRPDVLCGLLLQLAIAMLAIVMANSALRTAFGERAGLVSAVLIAAYFPLAFYENKYLSASLGVAANVLVWFAFAAFQRRPHALCACAVGAASGLSVLGRPNLLLALPFTLLALLWASRAPRRSWHAPAFVIGLLLALAPMAMRNAMVTGSATVLPAHGGGTSFYIGNNPHADGRWNTAGGLLSGQVGLERAELLERLSLQSRTEAEDAAAIGRALYRRAFTYITEQPADWLALEGKKLWLLIGNRELTHDYDLYGEREILGSAVGIGVPFAVLLSLMVIGAAALWQRPERCARAWLVLLLGQAGSVTAANLFYFTSSQHRLPLALVAAALAGPGVYALVCQLRARRQGSEPATRLRRWVWACALMLLLQGFVPRESRSWPSTAHAYNLAVVHEQLGDLTAAAQSMQRALQRRPEEAVFRLEHASLLRRLGDFAGARRDLDLLRAQRSVPDWVRERERIERRLLERGRSDALHDESGTPPR
jgi:hypothetical protein